MTSVVNLLKRVSVFSGLTLKQLKCVVQLTERRFVAKGKRLIRTGDHAQRVYVVLSGKFVVLSKGKAIAEILPGEPIGELAFFAGVQRTTDVVAARDSELLQLDRDSYGKLSQEIPELSNQILSIVSRRLAKATKNSTPLPPRAAKTVALVPAGNKILPSSFVKHLEREFSERKEYFLTDGTDIPKQDQDWLYRCEDEHDHVFLVCRETHSEAQKDWLSIATNNCDSVCLVLDIENDESSAQLASHEAAILSSQATCPVHIVLWSRKATARPQNSAKWLTARRSLLRHHVCEESPETVARWLRFLNGTALGAVLCGGGALGTAHLGAVQALYEHGYEIDIFGGTSVGAAMAGALASRTSPEQVMNSCIEIFVRSKAMSKLAVPVHGLLDHHIFDQQLKKHYGEWDIEDLPLNFFGVSTSLTTNDMHVHRTGKLWETVRASGSIPAIFPPMICRDGEVLIDGAIVDNLPVSVMRETKAGPNIILNFQDSTDWRVQSDYNNLPTRWQTFWRLITRQNKSGFPTIANILSRTMVVTARRRESEIDLGDDILIEIPALPDMGALDWKMGRQQYDLAYQTIYSILSQANACATDSMPKRLEVLREAAAELTEQD